MKPGKRRAKASTRKAGAGGAARPRPYDASGRRARAEATRTRLLDAAAAAFFRSGYAATTVGPIARAAAVSVETVYKRFGGKPGLVQALCVRALLGNGDRPAEQRSDTIQEDGRGPRDIIAAWGALACEVSPLVSPLLLLARAAAAVDPDMAKVVEGLDRQRLDRMAVNASRLQRSGRLRAGLRAGQIRDVLWTYTAPELYRLLVLQRGWTIAAYGQFLTRGMSAFLLPDRGG